MKFKKIKVKLELNKITICRLDNIELGFALAGQCPPPDTDESDGETACSVDCDPDTWISTKPC